MDPTKTVKYTFDEGIDYLKFDEVLAKKFNSYVVRFINKSEENMIFFGGNLTGVQVVRFTTPDSDAWFVDILEVDEILLDEKIAELPGINQNFHVSSDLFNLSSVWLIHRFLNSKHLNDKQKHQAMLDVALAMNIRFLTSLLFRYFKYPADPQIAAATYAQLSYKFAIKQCGSWYATLLQRCEDFIAHDSIHYNTLKNFNEDGKIVTMLNDAQGRIRDMLKNIYGEFLKVHKQGTRITSTTSLSIGHDGEQAVRDKTKNLLIYTRYILSVISDKNSFVKQELLDVIEKVLHTMPPKLLLKTLEWSSVNYRHASAKEVEEVVTTTITHSFDYLGNHRTLLKETNDLAGLISTLRGVYMSSRSTDPDLLEMREKAERIVKLATGIKNDSVIASVRTGFLLYIVLRAFCMHHYSS